MPGADDVAIFHAAFVQRAACMAARVFECAHDPVHPGEEHLAIIDVDHGEHALGHIGVVSHVGPFRRAGKPGGVVDGKGSVEDEITTEICGGRTGREPGYREQAATPSPPAQTRCQRANLQRERRGVDQPVGQGEPPITPAETM